MKNKWSIIKIFSQVDFNIHGFIIGFAIGGVVLYQESVFWGLTIATVLGLALATSKHFKKQWVH